MYTSQNVSIPRPPDVVTILWQRNPLNHMSPRTIVESKVIGCADPCTENLMENGIFRTAKHCLTQNGFAVLTKQSFGVFGMAVFIRTN